MILVPGKKPAPKGFPWLPRGNYKTVHVVRNRKGLGDFLQILAACEVLREQTKARVVLYGPKPFVPLGDLSPVEVREYKGEPGRNVCRIKNGEAWVYVDYPCPAIGNEGGKGSRAKMDRLKIFHHALGVEPGQPKLRISEMEKLKAANWCEKHTGVTDPFVLVFRSSETWKDYQHTLNLFFLMQDRGLPVVLLENQMDRMPVPNTHGLSIRENCAILSQARMVITPDTGWLHAAAMLQRPIFGLFGAQDPNYRQGIYNTPGDWHCGDCPHGKQPCWYKVCEGRRNYQPCMQTAPSVVLDKIEATIKRLGRKTYKPIPAKDICAIIPTFTRVGSTMLCDAIAALMNTEWSYWNSDRERELPALPYEIENLTGSKICKTHSFIPSALTGAVPDNVRLVTITRHQYDMLVSLLFHNRYRKTDNGYWSKGFEGMADHEYINEVIKVKRCGIKEKFDQYKNFIKPVVSDNLLTIKYEYFLENKCETIFQIAEFLGVKDYSLNNVLTAIDPKTMKSKYNNSITGNESFVRNCKAGDWKNILTVESFEILEQLWK